MTELLIGDFDPAAVETAVDADPFWSSKKETVEADGETFYAWGEDNEIQMEGRTPVRKLGIGGRLWVDEHVAAYTRSTPVMEEVLAGCSGQGPTLAEDDTYAGIAQRLDGFEGAFDATITNQVREAGQPSPGNRGAGTSVKDIAEALEGVTAYGFATGRSDDPDQARLVLVLASETEELANENIQNFLDRVANGTSARTGELWSKMIEVESSDIDGDVRDLRAPLPEQLGADVRSAGPGFPHRQLLISPAARGPRHGVSPARTTGRTRRTATRASSASSEPRWRRPGRCPAAEPPRT